MMQHFVSRDSKKEVEQRIWPYVNQVQMVYLVGSEFLLSILTCVP